MNNTFIKHIKQEEEELEHICILTLLQVRTFILKKLDEDTNGLFISHCKQDDWYYDFAIKKDENILDKFKSFVGWQVKICEHSDDEIHEHIIVSNEKYSLHFYRRHSPLKELEEKYFMYEFESVFGNDSENISIYEDGSVEFSTATADKEMIIALGEKQKMIEFCIQVQKDFDFKNIKGK